MKTQEPNKAIYLNEDAALKYLEQLRWPNGTVCPHCGATGAYKLQPKVDSKRPVRKGVWKCKSCRKQFTVKIGTILKIATYLSTNGYRLFSSFVQARKV
jgi:transposase-like protein